MNDFEGRIYCESFLRVRAFLCGDLDQDRLSKQMCLDHGASKEPMNLDSFVDSSVFSIHHDPERSWITDRDPDQRPKERHPYNHET